MDNLGSRKGKAVRDLIRSAGAKLFYLPKYSPDFNPIEQVFAKLKHLLRKTAARTIETICATIGQILGAFTAEECTNYFRNSLLSNLNLSRSSLPPGRLNVNYPQAEKLGGAKTKQPPRKNT
jgi:transposase